MFEETKSKNLLNEEPEDEEDKHDKKQVYCYLAIPTPVSGVYGALALSLGRVSLQSSRGCSGAGSGLMGTGAPVMVFGAPRGPGAVAAPRPVPSVLGDPGVSPRGRLGSLPLACLLPQKGAQVPPLLEPAVASC